MGYIQRFYYSYCYILTPEVDPPRYPGISMGIRWPGPAPIYRWRHGTSFALSKARASNRHSVNRLVKGLAKFRPILERLSLR